MINTINDIYKNTEEYNPNKKGKLLIVFDDLTAVMLINKKLNPIVTELFIRGRKLNISLVFVSQSYFAALKSIRVNSTHYFVMKIPNKRDLQQIAFSNSSDINFQNFMNLYKKCTTEPYFLLAIDTTLASDNSLRFRKNLLERIQKLIMTIDDKIKGEKHTMSTETQQKYQHYHQVKLINMNIIEVQKYCHLIKVE